MNIEEISADGTQLKIKTSSNEESLFMLLKGFLEDTKGVDIVGVTKDHHLIDETEFFLRVESGNAKDVFKKALATIKKELETIKVK